MGSDFYGYYVPYEDDKNNALQKLRQREFKAGRYDLGWRNFAIVTFEHGIMDDPANVPSPGCKHHTIEEALAETGDGTQSILDLTKVIEGDAKPTPKRSDKVIEFPGSTKVNLQDYMLQYLSESMKDCGIARVPSSETLIKYLGTDKPTRKQLTDGIWDYFNDIEHIRGTGVCITLYEDGQPTELFFGGWSYD